MRMSWGEAQARAAWGREAGAGAAARLVPLQGGTVKPSARWRGEVAAAGRCWAPSGTPEAVAA